MVVPMLALVLSCGTDKVKVHAAALDAGQADLITVDAELVASDLEPDIVGPDMADFVDGGGKDAADVCVPQCEGKACGDDGCGGECGSCPENTYCEEGACACEYVFCENEDMAPWLCCSEGQVCGAHGCCTPDCETKECGEDGCGGKCGECAPGGTCIAGECTGPPTPIWAKQFGSKEHDVPYAVAVDDSGNIYLAGEFASDFIDFGGGAVENMGEHDAYVVRLGPDGSHAWTLHLGNEGWDRATDLVRLDDGLLLLLRSLSSSIAIGDEVFYNEWPGSFLVRLSFDGVVESVQRLAEGGSYGGNDLAVVGDRVAVGGVFLENGVDVGGGPMTLSGGEQDPCDTFLAVLDSAGQHVWSLPFGGNLQDFTFGVGMTGDWVGAAGLTLSPSIALGGQPLSTHGGFDGFFAMFGKDGEHLWSWTLGGTGDDGAYIIAPDQTGGAFVEGEFESAEMDLGEWHLLNEGKRDAFLARVDETGLPVWVKQLAGQGDEIAFLFVDTPTGALYVTGSFGSPSAQFGDEILAAVGGKEDAFLARLDENGQHAWSLPFGGSEDDVARAMAVMPSGVMVVAGSFASSDMVLGDETLSSAGGKDIFLVQFAQ